MASFRGGHGKTAGGGKPIDFQSFFDLFGAPRSSQPFFFGNFGDLIHPDPNSLTMAFPLIVVILLNGVSKCVPEIQEHALAGIELIRFHNAAFDIHTPGNDFCQGRFKSSKEEWEQSRSKSALSLMQQYLMTSPMPSLIK